MPPDGGPGLQSRHVTWLGIEPVTFWFAGQHPIYWTTPARAMLFSKVVVSIYILTNSGLLVHFPFLHVLANTYLLFFFIIAILTGVRWYLMWFWFAFPWWLVMLSIFSCTCWLFVSSLETCLFGTSIHFFIWIMWVFKKRSFVYLFISRERGKEGERGTETSISCLSHILNWGPGPQPSHVLWPGIEPAIFQSAGWCSDRWGTPVRVNNVGLVFSCTSVVLVPYIFWILTHYLMHTLQIFSLISWVAFSFC